jgi:hypothetical protein
VKTSSRSSLNSPKEPNPTQSYSAMARKIRRGRAQACGAWTKGRRVPSIPRTRAAAVGQRELALRRGSAFREDADVVRICVGVW